MHFYPSTSLQIFVFVFQDLLPIASCIRNPFPFSPIFVLKGKKCISSLMSCFREFNNVVCTLFVCLFVSNAKGICFTDISQMVLMLKKVHSSTKRCDLWEFFITRHLILILELTKNCSYFCLYTLALVTKTL